MVIWFGSVEDFRDVEKSRVIVLFISKCLIRVVCEFIIIRIGIMWFGRAF